MPPQEVASLSGPCSRLKARTPMLEEKLAAPLWIKSSASHRSRAAVIGKALARTGTSSLLEWLDVTGDCNHRQGAQDL